MEAAHTGYYQPELRPLAPEDLEGPQQPLQVFVRMECGDTEDIRWRSGPAPQTEEFRIDAVMDDCNAGLRQPVNGLKVMSRGFRHGHQPRRTVGRRVKEDAPEGELEPAEILRVTLMLQVVEDRHHRAAAKQRRRESGVEQDVEMTARHCDGERDLLPKDPGRPRRRHNRLRDVDEIIRFWDQVGAGFAVSENEIPIHPVDFRQSGQHASQINFRTAHTAGDQVKGIDADPQWEHLTDSVRAVATGPDRLRRLGWIRPGPGRVCNFQWR